MGDKEKIEAAVQLYFDSLHESSSEKVYQAFHPAAMVSGYLPDGLHEMNLDEFAEFVSSQQPSPKQSGEEVLLEIVSIEVAGSTAAVKVRDGYLGMVFLDTLSFLEIEGEWRIYNKLFHVESA
jgi:hypothetical protein